MEKSFAHSRANSKRKHRTSPALDNINATVLKDRERVDNTQSLIQWRMRDFWREVGLADLTERHQNNERQNCLKPYSRQRTLSHNVWLVFVSQRGYRNYEILRFGHQKRKGYHVRVKTAIYETPRFFLIVLLWFMATCISGRKIEREKTFRKKHGSAQQAAICVSFREQLTDTLHTK